MRTQTSFDVQSAAYISDIYTYFSDIQSWSPVHQGERKGHGSGRFIDPSRYHSVSQSKRYKSISRIKKNLFCGPSSQTNGGKKHECLPRLMTLGSPSNPSISKLYTHTHRCVHRKTGQHACLSAPAASSYLAPLRFPRQTPGECRLCYPQWPR